MSIGNLNTDGNKGNNFPFQLKVLQGLQCTCDELKAIGVDTAAIEAILTSIAADIANLATEATLQVVEANTTGVARTPGIIRPTNASGDVNTAAATFYSVSVANVGLADGTVLGVQIKPGEILNFSADALNNFFTSFAYDATGTEFIIIYVA
jgi:UDP-N-acetylmuramyl tripeptide synthase